MKKVYQTIVDEHKGNCMQAAVASLFELPLEEVPNFIEHGTDWFQIMYSFFKERGHDICYINRNGRHETELLKRVAKFDGGVNGYLYASVQSQTFPDVYHAVVIDTDLNIVHDPNPNQLAMRLTPDDILDFISVKDMVIGKTGRIFTMEEWENATEEEKNANVHHANSN